MCQLNFGMIVQRQCDTRFASGPNRIVPIQFITGRYWPPVWCVVLLKTVPCSLQIGQEPDLSGRQVACCPAYLLGKLKQQENCHAMSQRSIQIRTHQLQREKNTNIFFHLNSSSTGSIISNRSNGKTDNGASLTTYLLTPMSVK